MTAMEIIDSAAFKGAPLSAQALWFHLFARAERDEQGITTMAAEVAATVRCEIGAGGDDVRCLLQRGLLVAEDGILYF